MCSSGRTPGAEARRRGDVDAGVADRLGDAGQRSRLVVDLDDQIHRHAAGSSRRGAVILARRRRLPSVRRRRAGCGRPVPSRRARRPGCTAGTPAATGSRSRCSPTRSSRRRSSRAMRASSRGRHDADRRSQSARVGVRLSGSEARAVADLVQAEADLLGDAHERDAPQRVAVVAALTAARALGVDQALGLVEAQRRRGDAGARARARRSSARRARSSAHPRHHGDGAPAVSAIGRTWGHAAANPGCRP